MSDEHYALSPAPLQPPPPTEADYEAIFAAVMETVRGRWFLSEFGRRNRQADTQIVLGAIERLEAMVRGVRTDPSFERIRNDIRDMADAIAATRREIAALRPDGEHSGIGEATEELDAIVMATERATSNILAAAESIQETAWTLREQGLDGVSCDKLDRCATDVYLACSFQDLTGQRTRKVIHVLRFLEDRINAMVEILGDDGKAKTEPARTRAPLDIDMDQAEIDAVIPTTHADRGAPAAAKPADPETVAAAPFEPDSVAMASMPLAEPAHPHATFDHPPAALPEVSPIATTIDAGEPASAPADEFLLDDVDLFADVVVAADVQAEVTALDASSDKGSTEAMAANAVAPEQPSGLVEMDRPDGVFTAEPVSAGDEPVDIAEAEAPPASPLANDIDYVAADAAIADTTPVDAEPPVWAQNIAPDTRTLMADLLAIIRPAETSEESADDVASAGDDAAAADVAAASPVEPAPRRQDLRLMQPIAPGALSSDFVIVALDTDSDRLADQPPAMQAPAMVAAEPVVEAFAELDTDVNAVAEEQEPFAAALVIAPPPDTDAPMAGPAQADVVFATDDPAPAKLAVDVIDNDLLMAAEALGPQPFPPADSPAAAANGIAGIDADLLIRTDAPSPEIAPGTDTQETVQAEAVDALAPTSPTAAMTGAAGPADHVAATDATATEVAATEVAATDEVGGWPDVTMTASLPLPATENVVDESAAQFAVVLPQAQLTATATAALAALAMSAPSMAMPEAAADSDRDEIGHADPLAAVTALSVEERIALFS